MNNAKTCSICKKSFDEYGNNPSPFHGEVCCDDCNNKYVVHLRIYQSIRDPQYALHFKEDGTLETLKPKDKYFTLQELQGAVGGYIELYPCRYENKLIVCDEEGLIKHRPLNTLFANLTSIKLVGDVLLCPVGIFEAPDEEET